MGNSTNSELKNKYNHVVFIAHAGGGALVNEILYRRFNCKEGFEQHYAAGNRTFELDFIFSKDRELCCLHGWDAETCGEGVSHTNKMTLSSFQNHRIHGCLTTLTIYSLLDLLRQYKDAEVCMDNKTPREEYKEYTDYLHKVLSEQPDNEDLSNRLIPEVFSVEMYEYVVSVHPFFTKFHYSNRENFPTPEEMSRCPKVRALSLCHRDLSSDVVQQVKSMGKEVNAWTVDSPTQARQLLLWGVAYVTSNDITRIEELGLGTTSEKDVFSPGSSKMGIFKGLSSTASFEKYDDILKLPPGGCGVFSVRSVHGRYLSAQKNGQAEWNRDAVLGWEKIECCIIRSNQTLYNATASATTTTKTRTVTSSSENTTDQLQSDEDNISTSFSPSSSSSSLSSSSSPSSSSSSSPSSSLTSCVRTSVCTLRSMHGKYFSAQRDGTFQFNRTEAKGWEKFTLVDQGNGTVALGTVHGKYVSVLPDGKICAVKDRGAGTGECERVLFAPA